jgi:hypothetical protein
MTNITKEQMMICKDCPTFPKCEGSNIEDCNRREKPAEIKPENILHRFIGNDRGLPKNWEGRIIR